MADNVAILGTTHVGGFRLNYVPVPLTQRRQARVYILIGGVAQCRIRIRGVSIQDVLNATPDTATFTIHAPRPATGQAVRISIDADRPRLLFAGQVQADDMLYEGRPDQLAYPVRCIDDTYRLNMRRPIGAWFQVSATTVAIELVARFAPGFTTRHVQAGLPLVSISCDGTEDFTAALGRVAQMIGGYHNVEDLDVWLFQTDPSGEPPDPITSGYPFLDSPPITITRDESQLMTRVYGKGAGAPLLEDVAATETLLPIEDPAVFPTSGTAIAAVASDGASSERFTYTGIHPSDLGTLVGPGVTPPSPPVLAAAPGSGLTAGTYQYAYTDVTPSGESLPSPLGSIVLAGVMAPPTSAPGVAPASGTGLSIGTYWYVLTYLNGIGETLWGPGAAATTASVAAPTVVPTASSAPAGSFPGFNVPGFAGFPHPGDSVAFAITNVDATGGETLAGPVSTPVIAQVGGSGAPYIAQITINIPAEAQAGVSQRYLYLRVNGAYTCRTAPFGTPANGATIGNSAGVPFVFSSAAPPASNSARLCRVTVTLPLGGAGTVGRRLYRTLVNTQDYKLLGQWNDNTTTSYLDVTADATLAGAAGLPASNTAAAARVQVSNVAIGPTPTTARKIYRTIVNGAQLKLWTTLADNTTTNAGTDSTPDGSLGATAPSADTSGFTQPAGQVQAGSTTLITAGAPFPPTGGWVRVGSNDALVRYTSISGNTLVGIPPSGAGSITATVPYGSQCLLVASLTGVAGLTRALFRGAPINIWIQRDDLAAQAEAAARESTPTYTSDGIHEYTITDERRAAPSLTALCDAHLQKFGRPIITVQYATRDKKTKSGKTVAIDLVTPPIHEALTIQAVTITEIDSVPAGLAPRFAVTASSVRFSIEDILRRMADV